MLISLYNFNWTDGMAPFDTPGQTEGPTSARADINPGPFRGSCPRLRLHSPLAQPSRTSLRCGWIVELTMQQSSVEDGSFANNSLGFRPIVLYDMRLDMADESLTLSRSRKEQQLRTSPRSRAASSTTSTPTAQLNYPHTICVRAERPPHSLFRRKSTLRRLDLRAEGLQRPTPCSTIERWAVYAAGSLRSRC